MGKDGARTRPKTIQGTTQEIETAYGDLFVTINEDGKGPFEVFAQVGKAGGYTQSFTEALQPEPSVFSLRQVQTQMKSSNNSMT